MTDRIEKSIEVNAPVSRVWRALTDHVQFGAWFGVEVDCPFVVGEPVGGRKTRPCSDNLEWAATIVTMEPERLFSFTWVPYALGPDEGRTLVEFTLEPSVTGTLVRVVESGFDKLPLARRLEAFPRHSEGWEIQLQNLADHLVPTGVSA